MLILGNNRLRKFLIAFYEKYNPEKIKDINKIVETYKEAQGILIKQLGQVYELEPDYIISMIKLIEGWEVIEIEEIKIK